MLSQSSSLKEGLNQNVQAFTNSSVGAHHQHGKIWAIACEPKDGRSQVLVMSCQVNKRDHLGGAFTDLLGCPRVTVVHHLEDKRRDALSQNGLNGAVARLLD